MIIFTKPNCEKCEDIKFKLKEAGVPFEEKNTKDPQVLKELAPLLAGRENPLLPVIQFSDGAVVSNDMGLYKELKARKII